MKRSDTFAAGEILLLVLAALGATLTPHVRIHWGEAAWFLAGIMLLTFSDVWLPRGDAIAMSSSLALGALLLLDARNVLVMLLVAEAVALIPAGQGRDWRRSLASIAANATAVVVCSALLVPLGLHPSTGVLRGGSVPLRPEQHLFILALGGLFAALEFNGAQLESAVRKGRPVRAAILGGFSFGGWLIAAQASAGVLAALMYRTMGAWGLALAVVMILVMRQAFVLLLDIKQAYNSTIDVLVKAMEVQSPEREGLAERNATLSTAVGRELGLHGSELERLRYAGLLLGLGLEADDAAPAHDAPGHSSRIIEGVEFLKDVVPVLRLCDSIDYSLPVPRNDLVSAYVVTAVGVSTGTVPADRLVALQHRVSPRLSAEVDTLIDQLSVLEEAALQTRPIVG